MTAGQAITFLVFAVVAAITPGPSNLILTSTGAHVGLLRGLPCLGGVVIGMGLMLFLVVLGLGNVVLARPALFRAERPRLRPPTAQRLREAGFRPDRLRPLRPA